VSIYAVTSWLIPEHAKRGVFPMPLPLNAAERKFARQAGWKGIYFNHARSEAIRPNGSTCGAWCAVKEIREARTRSFLEAAK
jgi:hypothetical protein